MTQPFMKEQLLVFALINTPADNGAPDKSTAVNVIKRASNLKHKAVATGFCLFGKFFYYLFQVPISL